MIKKSEQAFVILAAGVGTRIGENKPKQFLTIQGKPLIYYTIHHALSTGISLDIYVVTQASFKAEMSALIEQYFPDHKIQILNGGKERFHSTQEALRQMPDYEFILIHDAARPFITKDLIQTGLQLLRSHSVVIPVVEVTDSLRQINVEGGSQILNRNLVKSVQTPQFFKGKILKKVFSDLEYNSIYSDDSSVMEIAGYDVFLMNGHENNIKITYPRDLVLGEYILKNHSVL